MYVCICLAVSEAQVRASINAGARTVEDVGDHCEAGTGCGSCHERISILLDRHSPDALADLAQTA